MFVIGLGLFTAASLAIALAPSATWLIAARAVQGVGAAILAPSTLALLTTHFVEGPDRTRALALYAATAGIGASLGLVVGGIVADWLSWRIGFFINVPIGIVLMIAARRALAETEKHAGALDLGGALFSTLGMAALVYGIVRSASAGWNDPVTLTAVGVGVALIASLFANEARVAQPIMPLRLFASRARTAALGARLLYLGAMAGFWFFTTQYLQGVIGYSPLAAGVAFLPTTIPNFASALAVPKLTKWLGNARLLAAALAVTMVGMLWLSRVSADTDYLTGVALPMILIGLGQGAALGPLTVAAVAGVAEQDAGAASGLVNVAHQLGATLGLGVLVVVFAAAGAGLHDEHVLLAHRVAAVFETGASMLALAFLLVVALIVRPGKVKATAAPATCACARA
jgi:predicted MFS family arabinose efflux permease